MDYIILEEYLGWLRAQQDLGEVFAHQQWKCAPLRGQQGIAELDETTPCRENGCAKCLGITGFH